MAEGKFITLLIALLISFLGLIRLGFRLPMYLRYQILLIFVLILMTTVLSFGAYYDKDWAWLTLGMIFLVVLINLFYAYLKISSGFITFGAASFFSSVGFFISMVSLRKKRFRSEEEIEIVQPPKIQPPKRVSKEFMPGKYVASQTGKRYHAPKCQWAKKINEDKAVWFDTEEEAEREGYEKDKCVA